MLNALVVVALAGTRLLQNDNFNGTGTVNSAVSFGEYEGPAVLFTPDGGYPLKIIAIDVLSVTYNQGAPGQLAGYQVDVWDESGGRVDPPRRADGGRYPPTRQEFVQLTTSSTQFNRITLPLPLVIDAGRLFVSVGEQLSTAVDNCTVAIDTAPLVPGANWYRGGTGTYTPLELPDGGFLRGINHNWVIRAVVETPDLPVAVTSVFPNSGVNSMPTPVVISGTNFELTAKAFVGTHELAVTARTGSTSISAVVPAGLTAGLYPVRVENSATSTGSLPNGFAVLLPDGGNGSGGGAGGSGGSSGGGGGAGGTGGGGGSGGSGVLRLDDITPAEGFSEELTKVVLTGAGFASGAQVLVGPQVLDMVSVRSAAVINAEVPRGMTVGVHDVVVLNLDGQRSTLKGAFTVRQGGRGKGCGCDGSGLWPAVALIVLICFKSRRGCDMRGAPCPSRSRIAKRSHGS